jgi:hypothetical protein
MKRILLVVAVLAIAVAAHAKYIPDPIVKYKIDARLDVQAKTVKGHEIITWKNHSSDFVPDLQFHMYLNAFKNNLSTFMREDGAESHRAPFRNKPDSWGYEQIHMLKVDGADLTGKMEYIQPDDGNVNDQTVMRVMLPKPIPPQGTVTIEIDWTSKMPHVFVRTGFHDNFFLVAQWFPKPGVYEAAGERHRAKGGWNTHQFHSSTEFYADYGNWDVNLTVPADFEIAATGAMKSQKPNADGTTTYNFQQEDVHEFAWTTQPKSQVMKVVRTFKADQMVSPDELLTWAKKTGVTPEEVRLQDVNVTLFIQREHRDQIDRHFRAAFAGIKWFGLMFGKYPYDVLTVVDPPYGGEGAGGMEYPTFITAGTEYWPGKHASDPEGVTVHEFGHQFWYGMVGNNEFEEAWLDEGINSYSTTKALAYEYKPFQEYENISGVPIPGRAWTHMRVPSYPWAGVDSIGMGQYWEWIPQDPFRSQYRMSMLWENARTDEMERYAWLDLDSGSYGVQAYTKPELMLHTLEALLGDAWPRAIRTYQQRWRFRHPDAIDFMDTVKEVSGRDMKWFFDQTIYGTGRLDYSVSFTNEDKPTPSGFIDVDGKPQFRAAQDKADKNKEPVESEVLVRRLGDQTFPVTVQVKFADGRTVYENWDGQYRWTKFKYANRPKIVEAAIDPGFQWKLEVARTDDTYLAKPVKLAPEKWYLRWVVWIQNVMAAASFFA